MNNNLILLILACWFLLHLDKEATCNVLDLRPVNPNADMIPETSHIQLTRSPQSLTCAVYSALKLPIRQVSYPDAGTAQMP